MISKMAILDDSASSCGVLNSLLAWAVLAKYENPKQATKFVAAALSSLRVSMKNGIRRQEALQHVLAGILICALEMHLFSQSSPVWLLYLSGTKNVINQFYQHNTSEDTDQTLLFQWVLYFDTLAQLGLEKGSTQFIFHKITMSDRPTNKIMELFSEFCYNVLTPDDPRYFSTEYISWLGYIENQLISTREQLTERVPLLEINGDSESLAVKELFVLAVLVYFTKKSTKLIGSSSKTNEWIESAFQILSETKHCNKPFPLFIFGLEARTDSRRLLILDVIDSTSKKFNARGLVSVRKLLLKAWVQYDLHAGDDLRQDRDMCYFLGVFNFVPCLV
ncbi:hypothetical protein PISL3812_01162 [Talaromyces islandicus]|uniref:Uncharacterized protein n=1 Tax=Talaromyces islandicus TaxID=28573 RepID=A0A0U1LN18_TALIS|nr:hypothetical protein PISL3812_01162 [Talaromyces islandicus]